MQSVAVAHFVDESSYKAVCYKCHYVGDGAQKTCPLCNFPIILETNELTDDQPEVVEIFDRLSVNVGAPPLPGVDGRPRKFQLMEEERKRRQLQVVSLPIKSIRRATTLSEVANMSKVRVTFAFVSAFLVGLVAAVASGGI